MHWKRSSFCTSTACVEVGRDRAHVLVRDSKDPVAAPQRYTGEEWSAFVLAVKAGEFDNPVEQPPVT